MSEGKVKRCPKCGGEMELGRDLTPPSIHIVGSVRFRKNGDSVGDKITPFYCIKCGYIELYRESIRKREKTT